MLTKFLSTQNNNTSCTSFDKEVELNIGQHEIYTLEDLRAYFDAKDVLMAYENGTLADWCESMYYEQEAYALRQISSTENTLKAICHIFKISYEEHQLLTPEEQAEYEEHINRIKQYTDDKAVLSKASLVALDQRELAVLLRSGERTIYLCHGTFSLPIQKAGIHYIGVATPTIEGAYTKKQYEKAGIQIENIHLPEDENPATKSFAEQADQNNGYDDFAEHHTSLCSDFHEKMKLTSFPQMISLQRPSYSDCAEFHSRAQCISAKNSCLSDLYQICTNTFRPNTKECIANKEAKRYSEHLTNIFKDALPSLQQQYQKAGLEEAFLKLDTLIKNSQQNLLTRFHQELTENTDYYEMYDFNYFLEETDIEAHDYRITDHNDPFFHVLETIFAHNMEYSFDPYNTIEEMEKDLNDRLATFQKAMHTEYKSYTKQIEELLQLLPVET